MPFAIDEANLLPRSDRQALRDFAFRMANGIVRVTTFASDRAQYRFIFATTANRPFNEIVGDIDADTAAAALQRLFPLRVSDSRLGVFDFLPEGFATSGALATHLASAIQAQHGTPYRSFLGHLVETRHRDPRGLRIE